ncbi:hypothetical protein OGAPHI_005015 [Ogataea philodendri]|uniref:Uncharacterized protein n=1 Tax=Ogataea philodendri TaxID=1378263 RepID=A0A9P8P2Q5_9ASCO|nr:uncharacterized protein OGAPHI_005015 [Ogataea philodendri]KAH3663614.1 hypothetical protein OGAPHI_005015 [Ogataea philodendri]
MLFNLMFSASSLASDLVALGFCFWVEQDEFVQTRTSCHHWEHRHLLFHKHLHEDWSVVVFEQLFHTVHHLFLFRHSESLETHGLGEFHKIWVGLVCVSVSVVVEQGLPLGNHSLLLVVEHNDLDRSVSLDGGGELGQGHVERSVSINVNNQRVWLGDLGTNGRWQTKSHGSETSRGDERTWFGPGEVLGSPHLVLAHTGGDNNVTSCSGGLFGDLLHESLWLDLGARSLLLIGIWVLFLELPNVLEPLRTRRNRMHQLVEKLQVLGHVTLDSLGSLDNLVDVLWRDLKMDNTSSLLLSSQLGLRSELGDISSHSVVESGTKSNNKVCLLHGRVGHGRAVHSKHVQGLFVVLVKGSQSLDGGSDRDLGLVCELLESSRAVFRVQDTGSHVQNWFLGLVDQRSSTLDALSGELGSGSTGDLAEGIGRQGGANRNGFLQDGSSDVFRQVDQNRTRTAAGCDLERLIDPPWQLCHALHHHVPFGARSGDSNHVGLLESVGSNGTGGNLAGKDDHWHTVCKSVSHRGNDVSSAGTRGHQNDAWLAAGSGVTLGHVAGTLLVAGQNKLEFVRVVDSIIHWQDSSTRIPENSVDVMSLHHLVENLTSCESDEGVVHLRAGK